MVKKYEKMKCAGCGKTSPLISSTLGVCVECIRKNFGKVKDWITKAHRRTREEFELPPSPPKSREGIRCNLCINSCRVCSGEKSFCGLRENKEGKLNGASRLGGYLSWYYDNLPTNCVADWVCAGGTGAGYPHFSHTKEAEYGYKNLAVFYRGCSFNCLFCQNWHWREGTLRRKSVSPEELVEAVDARTSCICFFGGDPSCQINHALKVAQIARERRQDKILRICFETNGSMSPLYLKKMAGICLESGGCIKFDLKAWREEVNIALCGASNKRTLDNFKMLASSVDKRPRPPFLIASTLLVPGYIDEEEIKGIARFIASLNPEIPYSLLAFYPNFYMHDLPTTSKNHAQKCLEIARREGLKNVRIGNLHLLSNEY